MTQRAAQLDQLLVTGGGLLPEPAAPVEDWSGRTLGVFELEEQIGVGGMATVYRASRRDRQFEQQVAIKVLGEQFAGDDHLQRFLRERQILADLDHPGIARIIDGGVEKGRPYLVMDLVAGVALDEYCDAHTPSAGARLAMFIEICRAVAHAHSKGVVHQDLKPANVLITEDGQPRLLDFGIAAVHDAADESEGRLFTPRYAAPEQFLAQPTSTATDTFQLGLLLHQLFGRAPAFGGTDDNVATLREQVLSHPPSELVPSVRIPDGWRKDLQVIVHRCLEKDPADRYPSVAHLIDDLQALREDQPLRSRADQIGYRLGKFSSRHRVALGVSMLIGVVAVTGALTMWGQIRDQRDRAAANARDSATLGGVVTDLLESVDPLSGEGPDIGVIISSSGFELSTATRGQPQLQRELVLRSGRAMLDLGHFGEVIDMVEPLVKELALLPSPPPRYAEYLSLLGYARYRDGKLEQGLEEIRQALAYQSDRIGIPADAWAQTLQRLALALRRAADFQSAMAHIDQALALLATGPAGWDSQRAQALSQRGLILTDLGQLESASDSLNQALALYAKLPGDHALRRAMTLSNLADTQRLQGQLDEARENASQSVTLLTPLADDNPRLLATARITLGNVAMAAQDPAAAAVEYRAALDTYVAELGESHPRVALVSHNLATALRLTGDCTAAIGFYDQAIAIAQASYPPGHPELVESRRQRALCDVPR